MRLNQTSKNNSSGTGKQNTLHLKPNSSSTGNSVPRNRDAPLKQPPSSSSSKSKPHLTPVLNPQNTGSVPRNPTSSLSRNTTLLTTHDVQVMSEQSRKVLEEIQKTKNNLLKQGVTSSSTGNPATHLGLPPAQPSSSSGASNFSTPLSGTPSPNIASINPADVNTSNLGVGLSPAHRAAFQTLQQANSSSLGFYISTDSHFGNAILPVLPRIVNNTQPATASSNSNSSANNSKSLNESHTPKMKLKELESYLTQCEPFSNPKIKLEQYPTSAHIAARMLYAAKEHLNDSMVCDLGSGCGVLSIGSVLVGANFVIGFEIDSDAIQVAKNNIEQILDEPSMSSIEFIQINLQTQLKMLSRFKNTFDVVIMNPPFGTKTNTGIDWEFLNVALTLVKPNGHIYSLHKTSTRTFFTKKFKIPLEIGPIDTDEQNESASNGSSPELINVNAKVLAEIQFDLPKVYKFHKEKSVDISVDLWCFEKR